MARVLDMAGTRRRTVVVVALLAAAVGVAVAVTEAFTGGASPSSGSLDNGTATALQTVTRRGLTSQTQVDGTLGYTGAASVVVPSGTAPSDVQHAEQSVGSAQAALQAAQTMLATDQQTLAQAQATLAAANLIYVVLLGVGGVVFPLTKFPHGARPLLELLPTGALSTGLRDVLASGAAFPVKDAVTLAVWAVAGITLAARAFRWE